LTDIGLLVFPGLKEHYFFKGFGLVINVCWTSINFWNKDMSMRYARQARNCVIFLLR